MPKTPDKRLTQAEIDASRELRLQAMAMQEIEGNPLDAEQIAMFEMFEREGWSHEKRLEHVLARVRAQATAKQVV